MSKQDFLSTQAGKKLLKKSTEGGKDSSMQSKQEAQSRFNTSQDGSLVMNFRQQVRQMQKEIEEKDKEINKLKRDQKMSKFQELSVELEEYKEECKRLNTEIKTIAKQEQNESKILNETNTNAAILATYKNDNINLSNLIRKLEEENELLKATVSQGELEKERINHKFKMSQKQILELNKQNQFLRQEMYPQVQGQRKQNQKQEIDQLKRMLDDRKSENYQQQLKIINLEKANSEQDRKLREIDQEHAILRNIETKEKEKLNEKINQLKQENERLEKELAAFEDNEDCEKSESEDLNNNKKSFSSVKIKTSQIKSNSITKRLSKVNNYDILNIAKQLKFRLLSLNISYQQLESLIFQNSLANEEQVSLAELTQSLRSEPFSVENADEATLLSRYLVEDNQEDQIPFDPNRLQDKSIVKSVFKKIIGSYLLFSGEEIERMEQFFANIFSKYKQGMMQTIKQQSHKKNLPLNFCDLEDFQLGFDFCDVLLNPRQQEYLDILNYQQTNSLERIEYPKLFDKFEAISKLQLEKKQKEEEDRSKLEQQIEEQNNERQMIQSQNNQSITNLHPELQEQTNVQEEQSEMYHQNFDEEQIEVQKIQNFKNETQNETDNQMEQNNENDQKNTTQQETLIDQN